MELFGLEYLTSQYFWTATAFGILLLIIGRSVVPAVNAVLDARAGKIAADLAGAEAAKAEAARLLADYQTQLAAARKEAAEVVSKARAEAEALATARLAAAEAELARKTDEARKSIAASEAEALRSIQGQVADLAVQVAEKLLESKLDAKLASALTDKALKELLN